MKKNNILMLTVALLLSRSMYGDDMTHTDMVEHTSNFEPQEPTFHVMPYMDPNQDINQETGLPRGIGDFEPPSNENLIGMPNPFSEKSETSHQMNNKMMRRSSFRDRLNQAGSRLKERLRKSREKVSQFLKSQKTRAMFKTLIATLKPQLKKLKDELKKEKNQKAIKETAKRMIMMIKEIFSEKQKPYTPKPIYDKPLEGKPLPIDNKPFNEDPFAFTDDLELD